MKARTASVVTGIVSVILSVGLVGAFLYWAVVIDPSDDASTDAGAGSAPASPLVVDPWDGTTVSALCIGGEEDYGSGPNAAIPVQEGIASFFEGIVVDDDCDATITVSLTGTPRSANYRDPESPGSGIEFYTGAEVQGTMSLTADGEAPLIERIGGSKSPPETLRDWDPKPRAPLGAPFWSVSRSSVCLVLQHWFGADDPNLSPCPELVVVTYTTMAGHIGWSEGVRADFLDDCLHHESMCRCWLYGAESVLTESEWLGVRDLESVGDWPEEIWDRVAPVWSECSPDE